MTLSTSLNLQGLLVSCLRQIGRILRCQAAADRHITFPQLLCSNQLTGQDHHRETSELRRRPAGRWCGVKFAFVLFEITPLRRC